ncbi:MAG: 30S ribosomal protein S6 [Actinobacteria bacterium QS_5_72_10]|nr:MAG: 30S ribosomal protein S6 [Actinobacteria bacterium QS_8_72_14]PSO53684.1 MAG: 30S ribosomal protein S6 [Actinobacteria bacterium QS_5_72_10]
MATRTYELMVITHGSLDEQAVQNSIERVTSKVAELGGTVDKVDHWGKRQFAYEIDDMNEGHYTVFDLRMDGSAHDELERQLRISDEVVRFKMIRPDLRVKRAS